MFLLANLLSSLGFLLALAIMLTLLLRRSYRYFGKRGKQRGDALVRVTRPVAAGRWSTNIDSPEQVAKFEVQLQETMRELSAQLDSKMVCLQVLLRQADEKIAHLERWQRQATRDGSSGETSSTPSDGEQRSLGMAADEGLDPLRREIFALADQGFSAVTIAHRVSHPLADVEAVLRSRGFS